LFSTLYSLVFARFLNPRLDLLGPADAVIFKSTSQTTALSTPLLARIAPSLSQNKSHNAHIVSISCYQLFSIVILDHFAPSTLCRDHIHRIPRFLLLRPPLSPFPLVTCIHYLQHPPPFLIHPPAAMANIVALESIPAPQSRPPLPLLFRLRLRRVLPQRSLYLLPLFNRIQLPPPLCLRLLLL
jgi:hypothetical protein